MDVKILNKKNIYKKFKENETIEIYFIFRIEKYEEGKDYVNDFDYFVSLHHLKNIVYEPEQVEVEIQLEVTKFEDKYILARAIIPQEYIDNTYKFYVYSKEKTTDIKQYYEYGELGLIKNKNNIYPEL